MPPHFPVGEFADVSLRVLTLPLAAIGASAGELRPIADGLPIGAVEVASANLRLAATPCDPDMFRGALLRHAQTHACDVLLVRTGLWPESLSSVTAEVALAAGGDVILVPELAFFRHCDGSLWLIPLRTGPFLAIGGTGLGLEMTAPFVSCDDRADGLCRAAAEIVRLSRWER